MIKKKVKKAYSLIELSIVIVIASILISGALGVSVSSINNAKIQVTNDRLQEIYRAIGNFLLVNKRLPCPASLKKVKVNDADYGIEVGGGTSCVGDGVYSSTSNSNLVYGMVPFRSLQLSNDIAEDGFESKITYIVDKNFTKIDDATLDLVNRDTFGTAQYTNTITIQEKPSATLQTVTNDAIIVLISHGSNKSGAFNSNSSTQNTRSSDIDEQNNDATTFNDAANNAVFDNTIIMSSGNSDVFDDIILYKTRNEIIEDFNAMYLIPCEDAGASFANVNASYEQIVYATLSCPNPNEGIRLTKKCQAYGTWTNIIASCP